MGCTLHSSDHSRYPIELGIPIGLGFLHDRIHEGLPSPAFKDWPLRFLESIPVGADLSLTHYRIKLAILTSPTLDLRSKAIDDGKQAIDQVVGLLRRSVTGEIVSDAEWSAAESAAWSAAWSAARSTALAAAESAAESAARSAAWSAESARYGAYLHISDLVVTAFKG